jgi:hypothetical protein
MFNKNLMEMAKNRFNKKNILTDIDFNKSLRDFILYVYINCDPAVYGTNWSKKLLKDIRNYGIKNTYRVLDKSDLGDITLSFPEYNYWDLKPTYIHPLHKTSHHVSEEQCVRKFYEIKISYLGKSESYTIRNLRKYQELDGYIFTFVDCVDDFNPKFIFVSHDDLYNRSGLTFTPMNGTKKQNKDNTNIGVGTTFKKGSRQELNLLYLNKLNGTSFEDLMDFLNKENDIIKKEFSNKWESGDICTPSIYQRNNTSSL